MVTVPTWSAARSGLLGDPGAVDASAQVNQFLGSHADTVVYQGNSILTPTGSGGTAWTYQLSTQDIDQPFTMSGTNIGRVMVPVLPVGNGADLIVSLYTDNAGSPGTLLQQTRVPKEWIYQLAAVSGDSGPSSVIPSTTYTGNALALAQFNAMHMGLTTTVNWPLPYNTSGFAIITSAQTWTGDWLITVGGKSGTTFFNSVYSVGCDAVGNVSQAVPQPSMPAVNDGYCTVGVTTDPTSGNQTVVVAGGEQVANTATNAVYTASFDPTTGSIASWSQQTNLPLAMRWGTAATYNGYFYFIGGNDETNDHTIVWYAQVQNGQITTWNTANSLPVALDSPYANVVDGMMIVYGGENAAGTKMSTCWYTNVNADGSLGAWQNGPTLPNTAFSFQTASPSLDNYGVVGVSNGLMYMLGMTANGLDTAWQSQNLPNGGSFLAVVTVEDGSWYYYGLGQYSYVAIPIALTPRISVPLPATGLTNGATYHLVLSQPNGDESDYLRTHDDLDVFIGNPTMQTRANGSTTWVAGTTGHAVPLQVYDQSVVGGSPWHTWQDDGARISTAVYATTPDARVLGYLEATRQPGPVLNQNPYFTTGTAPWAGHNGTLAQSSSFTHGGLPFSAQFTPNGVATQGYIESELITIDLEQPYAPTCWLYSPTGYSNCTVQINWYTAAGFVSGFISTTASATFNVAANTWTELVFTSAVTPPSTAVYGTIVVAENGTPPVTAVFYAAQATLQSGLGPMLPSVTECQWVGTWPDPGCAILTAAVQLV